MWLTPTASVVQEYDVQQLSGSEDALMRTIYQTEIERTKYLVGCYLRTRLRKVRRRMFGATLSRQAHPLPTARPVLSPCPLRADSGSGALPCAE